eukprot:TRINITY_DN14547_c0_g2_i1.p1 TRINITY_DN14547_c0_g2~~TRINITY_DN14547_c0_g2_i1.p1  ORF type:complete len:669 (-),score=135.78 TRINITY_DN14547_c0_g2_i1:424-2430(-)
MVLLSILFSNSVSQITGSMFSSNVGNMFGGAIASIGKSSVTITSSSFANNQIPKGGRGGAIFSTADYLTIQNSTILNNFADIGGGIFVGNTTGAHVGYVFNGQTVIQSSNVSNNKASVGGGLFFSSTGSLSVSSYFLQNIANSSMATDNIGCSGTGLGGALFFQLLNCSLVSLSGTTASQNYADFAGGALYSQAFGTYAGTCLQNLSAGMNLSSNSAGQWGSTLATDFAVLESISSNLSPNTTNFVTPGEVPNLVFAAIFKDSLNNLIPPAATSTIISVTLDPSAMDSQYLSAVFAGSGLILKSSLVYNMYLGWNSETAGSITRQSNLLFFSLPQRNRIVVPVVVQPCDVGFQIQLLNTGVWECVAIDGFLSFSNSVKTMVALTATAMFALVLMCFKASFDVWKESQTRIHLRNETTGMIQEVLLPNPSTDPYGHRIMFFSAFGGLLQGVGVVLSVWTSSNGYCHLHQMLFRIGKFFLLSPFAFKLFFIQKLLKNKAKVLHPSKFYDFKVLGGCLMWSLPVVFINFLDVVLLPSGPYQCLSSDPTQLTLLFAEIAIELVLPLFALWYSSGSGGVSVLMETRFIILAASATVTQLIIYGSLTTIFLVGHSAITRVTYYVAIYLSRIFALMIAQSSLFVRNFKGLSLKPIQQFCKNLCKRNPRFFFQQWG